TASTTSESSSNSATDFCAARAGKNFSRNRLRGGATAPRKNPDLSPPGVMRIAILAGQHGWHVRDLRCAAALLGHDAATVDFRKLHGGVAGPADPLAPFDAIIV